MNGFTPWTLVMDLGIISALMLIGKLIRVKDALKANKDLRYDIVCYPEQLSMVREYLVEFRGTGRLGLRTVNIDDAIKVLFEE